MKAMEIGSSGTIYVHSRHDDNDVSAVGLILLAHTHSKSNSE